LLQVHDVVVELNPTATTHDHVDLLLPLVPVAERLAEVGRVALVADPRVLELQRAPREARLHVGREAEVGGLVLDVLLQVHVCVSGHRVLLSIAAPA
jgi:hypothetical protein